MPTPQPDLATALARLEGDAELLGELIDLFLADGESYLAELDTALAREDQAGLQRAAHTLKGVLATFCAEPACTLAFRLEQAAREQPPGALAPLCAELNKAVRDLLAQLKN